MVILVNYTHVHARKRFSYAHEYAHALLDRKRSVIVTMKSNANEWIERRANAFASVFLMPKLGVESILSSLDPRRDSSLTMSRSPGCNHHGEERRGHAGRLRHSECQSLAGRTGTGARNIAQRGDAQLIAAGRQRDPKPNRAKASTNRALHLDPVPPFDLWHPGRVFEPNLVGIGARLGPPGEGWIGRC